MEFFDITVNKLLEFELLHDNKKEYDRKYN